MRLIMNLLCEPHPHICLWGRTKSPPQPKDQDTKSQTGRFSGDTATESPHPQNVLPQRAVLRLCLSFFSRGCHRPPHRPGPPASVWENSDIAPRGEPLPRSALGPLACLFTAEPPRRLPPAGGPGPSQHSRHSAQEQDNAAWLARVHTL